MASNLPSSFASAAAGQNANRDTRGGRNDGRGAVGDWSRRDGRSTNGTLTFRRSSTTPLGHNPSQPPASIDNTLQPQVLADLSMAQPQNYESGPTRYSKDELLDMFRPKGNDSPSRLFFEGWNPGHTNGTTARGWGKSNENHVPQEPGACWDEGGDTMPIGLHELSSEEKEAFSTEINSPLKPTQNKEGHQGGINGRKASLSQGTGTAFGVSSPSSATRPGTRRRETIESNPFNSSALASPTASGRFSREDPSFWFPRKTNELKENEPDEPDTELPSRDPPGKLPFGNLMRSNTSGSTGMSSIWPPSNQTTPGGFGNFALPTTAVGDKRVGGGAGGASRLAHLLPKDSSETIGSKGPDSPNPLNQASWRSRPRTDTDPFGGDDGLSGSAVLGGAQDTASSGMQQQRAGTLGTPVKGSAGDFGMSGLNIGGQSEDMGPLSPSETNPYRSPQAERYDREESDPAAGEKLPGMKPHDQHSNFGSIGRSFGGVPFDGSDRSQTSSVGAKAYSSLSTLSGWPAPGGPAIGTPDRERHNFGNAFGSSLFSPMGELQSPGLGNLNTVFGPASAGGLGTGSIGRGSKLGSLFPPAMQAQMQTHEHENNLSDSLPDLRQSNPLGAIGRTNFSVPARDTDSPMRPNRGVFEELFPSSDPSRSHGAFGAAEQGHHGATGAAPQSFTPVSGGLPFGGTPGGSEPPSTHIRQMVMPDRMRWVYLDPQGSVQGPFTGLEMNDWYKANFFSPDLRVKKVEDPEFEPLGQLIRRIGNSREPFLVPQVGIAHGPPAPTGPFSPAPSGGVVPPLSGVFPSFGRTLTAEEQNNLERRKQEEQYLMVQQREYVMRQQAMTKFQMPGGPALQHHSSAHSLQSQPSFGSITSPNPIGMPPQQPIGAMAPGSGPFDGSSQGQQGDNAQSGSGNGELFREEDLANYSSAERQLLNTLAGGSGAPGSGAQHVGAPGDASLRIGLPETGQLEEDSEGFRERLKEFEDLRAQHEAEIAAKAQEAAATAAEQKEQKEPTSAGEAKSEQFLEQLGEPSTTVTSKPVKASKKKLSDPLSLSLTQQVQQAQAAAAAAAQPSEPGMPMPFPPPPASSTPLPAPTAQRVRSNLPEQYSRSQSGSPDTSTSAQPPPLAPWAKDPSTESHKGPSLKEIQEAEARKAVKAEEAAAALRKAALEQEAVALREREKAASAAAGLPATSTWGHGSPANASTPWAKPSSSKGPAPTGNVTPTTNKKTLAEIQREEELRKQKAKESTQQTSVPAITSKSYANLAGKPGQLIPTAASPAPMTAAAVATPPPGSGWATVGAGGKVKAPTGPASQSRSASVTNIKPIAASPVKAVSKPIAPSNGKAETTSTAMEEFHKWVYRELSRGLSVSDITSFQAGLDVLPLDTSLIADAIYASSNTMNGQHFAEEFVRRKNLAERGVVEKQPSTDSNKAGGWNEVAKKGSGSGNNMAGIVGAPKEDDTSMQAAGFKVVPGRKKGKK